MEEVNKGPVHTGPSHFRSIRAISAVESMDPGTYHFHTGFEVPSMT
jgi:hypothetical protein